MSPICRLAQFHCHDLLDQLMPSISVKLIAHRHSSFKCVSLSGNTPYPQFSNGNGMVGFCWKGDIKILRRNANAQPMLLRALPTLRMALIFGGPFDPRLINRSPIQNLYNCNVGRPLVKWYGIGYGRCQVLKLVTICLHWAHRLSLQFLWWGLLLLWCPALDRMKRITNGRLNITTHKLVL